METVEDKYNELCAAAEQFKAAIFKFSDFYETKFVGLNEWAESIDEVLCDLSEDINSNGGDDE